MKKFPPPNYRQLPTRILSYTTLWLWRLFVVVLILLATLVAIGREMAPLAKENKTRIEAHLTALSGYWVQMESVEAEWKGLTPELQATRLSVGSAVTLDRVRMRVNLLRSAWSRSLVFDALVVNGATIEIPVRASDDKTLDMRAGLEFLFGSAQIRLRDVSLRLTRSDRQALMINITTLDVGSNGKEHWLQGMIAVADAVNPVTVSGAFTGAASDVLAGNGHAYFDFGDGSKLRDVLAFVADDAKAPLTIENPGGVQARIWLNWSDYQLQWRAAANIHNLHFVPLGYRLSYAGNLVGSLVLNKSLLDAWGQDSDYEMSVHIPRGEILINQQLYEVPAWGLQYQSRRVDWDNEPSLSLFLPQLDLEALHQYLNLIPSRELQRVLESLRPRGRLQNAIITWPVQEYSLHQPQLRANLSQVSVGAWEGAPALKKVDAYLETTTRAGFIEMDSQQGFAMHFSSIYAREMEYQQARGRVSWHINPVNHSVSVGSDEMQLQGEDGKGRAAFWLDIPPPTLRRANHLYLSVGIRDSAVQHRQKYLPNVLPKSLRQWLDSSVLQGEMLETGFIYRGSLRANEEHEQSVLFFSKIHDGALRFDPAWPTVSEMDATVSVENNEVHASVSHARMAGLSLKKAEVTVTSGNLVKVQAEVKGPGDHALRILRDTPLRDTLGSAFDDWKLEGDISGRISLGITLEKNIEDNFQEVALKLQQNDLYLKDVSLTLQQLTGDLYYSSKLGLSAPSLTARLWDQPQMLSILPVVDDDGSPDIQISMSGAVTPERLAEWSGLSFVRFFEGQLPVQGKLEVPLDEQTRAGIAKARLSLFSDLEGVAVDLPPPLKKSAESVQPLALTLDLFPDRQHYQLLYGSLITGEVAVPQQQPPRGSIWIQPQGTAESLTPSSSGLEIHAHLEKALLAEWLAVINRYAALNKKAVSPPPSKKAATLPPVFYAHLGDFQIGDVSLGKTQLTATYQSLLPDINQPGWRVIFDHAAAHGYYDYLDDTTQLPELTFERLDMDRWKAQQGFVEPAADDERELPDPLANVVPQDLPALKFHAKQVFHRQADWGRWYFTISPQSWGAAFNDFSVTMPGMTIAGAKDGQGASVLWHRDTTGMETQVSSRIRLQQQEKGVKDLFGIDRIIEAEKTDLQGSISWSGSPAHMSFKKLAGDMRISSEKGRFLNSNASTDLMRMINVFNFNTWARRLKLDFSDLYKKGISYDRVDGHVQLDHGKVVFDEPLVMISPSSRFTLQGTVDSPNNTIEADLAVTLPVSDNATWITALAGGLPAAAGVWVVSKLFEKQIDNLSSVSYTVSGSLDDPDIKFKHLLKDLPDQGKK